MLLQYFQVQQCPFKDLRTFKDLTNDLEPSSTHRQARNSIITTSPGVGHKHS